MQTGWQNIPECFPLFLCFLNTTNQKSYNYFFLQVVSSIVIEPSLYVVLINGCNLKHWKMVDCTWNINLVAAAEQVAEQGLFDNCLPRKPFQKLCFKDK